MLEHMAAVAAEHTVAPLEQGPQARLESFGPETQDHFQAHVQATCNPNIKTLDNSLLASKLHINCILHSLYGSRVCD